MEEYRMKQSNKYSRTAQFMFAAAFLIVFAACSIIDSDLNQQSGLEILTGIAADSAGRLDRVKNERNLTADFVRILEK